MLWASYGRENIHLQGLARSETGRVTGPWTQLPEPLFAHDGGHRMVFGTFETRLMLAVHTPNAFGRERAILLTLAATADGLRVAV